MTRADPTTQTGPSLPRRLRAPALVVAGAGACAAAVWWARPTMPGGPIPPCPSRVFLGVWCPGCGGSRAAYELLHLDIASALHFNALAVVAALVGIVTFAVWVAERVRDRSLPQWYRLRVAPHIVIAAIALWFVVRNIPVAPFTALRV